MSKQNVLFCAHAQSAVKAHALFPELYYQAVKKEKNPILSDCWFVFPQKKMRWKRSPFTISGRKILTRIKNIFSSLQEGTIHNKEQIQFRKKKILVCCLSNYVTGFWILLLQKVVSKDCYSLLFFFKILNTN